MQTAHRKARIGIEPTTFLVSGEINDLVSFQDICKTAVMHVIKLKQRTNQLYSSSSIITTKVPQVTLHVAPTVPTEHKHRGNSAFQKAEPLSRSRLPIKGWVVICRQDRWKSRNSASRVSERRKVGPRVGGEKSPFNTYKVEHLIFVLISKLFPCKNLTGTLDLTLVVS